MFIATYESRHFSFIAAGSSIPHAIEVMMATLSKHAATYQLKSDWYYTEDIMVKEMKPGDGYRDFSKIL